MTRKEKRLLIVDDDEAVLESITDYLRLKGYSVETANTGKEAIEKSNKCFFNLAVLDIKLPDMDGTELLTKMHETEPRMKKIMLTGYGTFDNAVESLNKRADAFLVKPVQSKTLLKVVEEKLREQDEELEMDKRKVVTYIHSRDRELEERKRASR